VSQSAGLIDPDGIPGLDLDEDRLSDAAVSLSKTATAVTQSASSVTAGWAGLTGVYQAPESPTLQAVMDPVTRESSAFSAGAHAVAKALSAFADEVGPIRRKLMVLRHEARVFVDTVRHGVTVYPGDPDHPATKAAMYQSAADGGPGGGLAVAATMAASGPVVIPWRQHSVTVEKNKDLCDRVAVLVAQLSSVQAECANTILKHASGVCVGDRPVTAVQAWQLEQPGVAVPWGQPAGKDMDCVESFGAGVGDSVSGMVQGVGTLFGFNPLSGQGGDGELAGQAWLGLASTLGGLLTIGNPVAWGMRWLLPDDGPGGVTKQVVVTTQDAVIGAVGGIVAWDQWGKNPARALGASAVNVGTFFIPGAVAGDALKAGAAGAKSLSVLGKVADGVLPGASWAMRGAEHAGVSVAHGRPRSVTGSALVWARRVRRWRMRSVRRRIGYRPACGAGCGIGHAGWCRFRSDLPAYRFW
jgi:hypothetical protein